MPCAEIGITGATMLEVCTNIIAKADEWYSIGAEIEAVRLGKKQEVEACTTVSQIYAVEETVANSWPSI